MSETRYEITITHRRLEKKLQRREWVKVRDTEEGDVYGYAPEIEQFQWNEVDVYKRTVETLDLKAVIAAVEGLAVK